MAKKVLLQIDKEGKVEFIAQGYQGSECMKSPLVQELLKLLEREGQIDALQKLYQEQKQEVEELL
ncbi:MAG: hypothetical protein ACK42C_00100 [Aquificaceae bacterium]